MCHNLTRRLKRHAQQQSIDDERELDDRILQRTAEKRINRAILTPQGAAMRRFTKKETESE